MIGSSLVLQPFLSFLGKDNCSGDPRVVSGWVKLNLVDECFMSSDRANSSGKPPACRCASTCEGQRQTMWIMWHTLTTWKQRSMPTATAFPYLCHSMSIYFLLELWNFPLPGYRSLLKKQAPRNMEPVSNLLWMNLNGFSCFIHASPKVVCIQIEPVRYTAHHGPCSRQPICRKFCR